MDTLQPTPEGDMFRGAINAALQGLGFTGGIDTLKAEVMELNQIDGITRAITAQRVRVTIGRLTLDFEGLELTQIDGVTRAITAQRLEITNPAS